MDIDALRPLKQFEVRSLVTHAVMAATFFAAIASGLLLEGRLGLVSFVAFVNFTAGVWVCQSIHSLGNSFDDRQEYEGIVAALRSR